MRFEYREMVTIDLAVVHVVWDYHLERVISKFSSKYAAKRWIRQHQEEFVEEVKHG